MKITVLGGLGYIGSYVTEMLVRKGHSVTVLDCAFFGHSHLNHILNKENCSFIQGDIRRLDELNKAIKGADCVIHLAGLVGDPACKLDKDLTWLYNIESSNIISDVCNYYNVKKLIFASSCSVYGASPKNVLLNTGSYLNPVSLYAESKIESEKIFLRKFNGEYITLRLATVFGFSLRMRFDLVVNLFTIKAIKEGRIQVFGGKQYRPFIHVKDAANAFVLLAEYSGPYDLNQQTFNLRVENIQVKMLGKIIKEIIPQTKVDFVNVKEDERNYKVSGDKIKWLLLYKPTFNIKTGIKELVEKIHIDNLFKDWDINKTQYINCDNLVYQCKRILNESAEVEE